MRECTLAIITSRTSHRGSQGYTPPCPDERRRRIVHPERAMEDADVMSGKLKTSGEWAGELNYIPLSLFSLFLCFYVSILLYPSPHENCRRESTQKPREHNLFRFSRGPEVVVRLISDPRASLQYPISALTKYEWI